MKVSKKLLAFKGFVSKEGVNPVSPNLKDQTTNPHLKKI